jgi:myo-inositol 2-dehydrogenase / D-chiro-inositol 1-dehydrogenase
MNGKTLTRRKFIQSGTGLAAASTLTIVKAESVRGTAANSMIEIGWVGLGGRGTVDARLLEKTGKAKIVAVADYFQYRIDQLFERSQPGGPLAELSRIERKNAHVGVDAYKEIAGSKVDAILLTTPPGFRPEHFRAAVAGKKHVFMEKPLAVDAYGCHVIEEAGRRATAEKLTVVVGLQRRYSKAYRRCKELIDQGALGQIVMAHSAYNTTDLWRERRAKPDKTKWPTRLDYEVEHWYFFKWLSGDHIVEQNVHNIDAISWMVGQHPLKAYGSGGRLWRKEIGDINDNFNIVYEFPRGVTWNNTCTQIDHVRVDVSETIYGTQGTFLTTAGRGGTGIARIEGVRKGRTGEGPTIYTSEGLNENFNDQEAEAFVGSVLGTDAHLDNTKFGLESTFTTILGREAAYRKEIVEWDKLWRANDRLSLKS